jgi:hypothetical protein
MHTGVHDVLYENAKETKMATLTHALQKAHGMRSYLAGTARTRVTVHARFEQPAVAKTRQWDSLIPDSDIDTLRYIADLVGDSAPISRVVLS